MLHLITVCVQSLVKEVSVVSSSTVIVFVDANRIFAFAGVRMKFFILSLFNLHITLFYVKVTSCFLKNKMKQTNFSINQNL